MTEGVELPLLVGMEGPRECLVLDDGYGGLEPDSEIETRGRGIEGVVVAFARRYDDSEKGGDGGV